MNNDILESSVTFFRIQFSYFFIRCYGVDWFFQENDQGSRNRVLGVATMPEATALEQCLVQSPEQRPPD